MDNCIFIRDLNFSYDNKEIFKNLDLSIKNGTFVTLVGPNGSGKSTLIKIILGLIETDAYITVNNMILVPDNLNSIRAKIGTVFANPNNQFVAETVTDDIAFSLENMCYEKDDIKNRISEVATLLGITRLLEREPNTLSGGEKQLVAFASVLAIKPTIIILDEAFTMVDYEIKEKIYKVLKKLNEKEKITIINVTHDLEDALYGKEIVVLNKGKIILQGSNSEVFKKVKIFEKIKMDLPFIVDLSNKLRYYELLDDIIFDMNEMVNIIWK